jgi:Agrobacterium tumefaciens protein Atu4866
MMRLSLLAQIMGLSLAALALHAEEPVTQPDHPYVGMWITEDGHVRHNLLPNGRYDEARGARESAYQGRYEVTGNEIFYWDDTGFTADGTFVMPDELHHGGMILFRQNGPAN